MTKEQSRLKIKELVDRFEQNFDSYKDSGYNETQVRREFIDPFFKALGWDIDNEQGLAEAYKDVIHEDRVKVENETKSPDYCFTLYGQKKFFVEAKKPSVKIKEEIPPAYQVRRYGWSAKLAVSIITDFEEFAVYDCTKKPNPADKASLARIEYFTFRDYADKFDFLWDTFSKEGILKGNLDRYLSSENTKKGTSTVDREFLNSMDEWRKSLASNIALRNELLAEADINHAVQLIIDRLIFLRICEDREIEPYGAIRSAAGKSSCYKGLFSTFVSADQKYNSGLFDLKKDPLTSALDIDDKVIKGIIDEMYYPASPFQFAAMPVEIMGNAYEQFLGKVIRLTDGHRAKIEEKPEVRKAGGVYYTPQYIVEYIVAHTLGELLSKEGMTPDEAAKLKILDPACGSGSFLIGAYQYLLDWHLEYYRAHGAAKKGKQGTLTPEGRLTTAEKKRILLNNLYGVDIDAQAVEVTKLSLLLKCLEGETKASITEQMTLLHERILPTLDANIKCGNSLIGPDYFAGKLLPDDEELKRVNPFDWEREFKDVLMPSSSGSFSQREKEGKMTGGFDCVIGNPPYIRIQTMKEWAPLEVEIYGNCYESAINGNYDIYVIFIEKALKLLNKNGVTGYILPNKFFTTDYGLQVRRLLSANKYIKQIIDFGAYQVFNNATTYTCLLFLNKNANEKIEYRKVNDGKEIRGELVLNVVENDLGEAAWSFSNPASISIENKINKNAVNLLDLPCSISRGSSSGADDVFMLEDKGGVYCSEIGETIDIEAEIIYKPIFATDFGRYRFAPSNQYVIIFPYIKENGKYRLLKEKELKDKYPKTFKYLSSRRKELEARKQYKEWYGYSAPRNLDLHENAHILIPLLADKGLFCRLSSGLESYCLMASGGFSITLSENKIGANYVLGVINSNLMIWRLRSLSNIFRGGWFTCTKQYIGQLPIRTIDFSVPAEKEKHDHIITLVDRMLDLHKKKAAAKNPADIERFARMIDATDKEIDALVYELYGLNEEEIGIVEGR